MREQGQAGTPISSQRLGEGRVTDNGSVGQLSLPSPISDMYNIIAMIQVPRARPKPLIQREGERKREIRLD